MSGPLLRQLCDLGGYKYKPKPTGPSRTKIGSEHLLYAYRVPPTETTGTYSKGCERGVLMVGGGGRRVFCLRQLYSVQGM